MRRLLAFVLASLLGGAACAQLRAIDHLDEREDTGIYARPHQKQVDAAALAAVVGLALSEGTDTRLGLASWRAIDAVLMTAGTTEVMKRVFGRPRPSQDPDPTAWFRGGNNRSFPSGEVAMVTAVAGSYILEYHEDVPQVWLLALLPAYMARARLASQAHWPTDVAAGAAVGLGYAWYARSRDTPLVLSVAGRSAFIGLRYRF